MGDLGSGGVGRKLGGDYLGVLGAFWGEKWHFLEKKCDFLVWEGEFWGGKRNFQQTEKLRYFGDPKGGRDTSG